MIFPYVVSEKRYETLNHSLVKTFSISIEYTGDLCIITMCNDQTLHMHNSDFFSRFPKYNAKNEEST
jgi:hypothetical protein